MRLRVLSLPALGFCLLFGASTTASAQSGAWCARMQGAESCGFATLAQCRATISGAGGVCVPNPRAAGPAYGPPPGAAAAVRRGKAERDRARREAAREAAEERRRAKRKEVREHARKHPNPEPAGAPRSATASPAPTVAGGIPVSEINVNAVPALSREGLRRVQMALKERGFDPGPLNGTANPLLNEAVRSFQTRYGIEVRGVIDNQTLLALGEVGLASQPSR